MDWKQRNSALVFAILAGLISLPLVWVSARNVKLELEGGLGNLFGDAFAGMTVEANALQGYVTAPVRAPLWLLVGIAIVASVLQLMRNSGIFAIPKIAEWGTAIVATLWIGLLAAMMLMPGEGSLGIGWFCGFISAVIPLVCLFVGEKKVEQREAS